MLTNHHILDNVEVVDSNTDCQVDPLPISLSGAAAISTMICGGRDQYLNTHATCWHLNPNGTWTAGEDMLVNRRVLTMTTVEQDVIVIGGATRNHAGIKSVEKYSLRKDKRWSEMKDAPRIIYQHCTVKLNTSYLMVTGGFQRFLVTI